MATIQRRALDDSALNVSWNKFSSKTQTSKELLDSSKNIDSVAGILFSSIKSPESAEPLENKTQFGDSLPDTVHDAQAREALLFDSMMIAE